MDHSKLLRRIFVAACSLAIAVSACSTERPDRVGSVQLRVSNFGPPNEHERPSSTPISVKWDQPDTMGWVSAFSTVYGTVQNTTTQAIGVSLEVVGLGLDHRVIRRPLTTLTVPASSSTPISVRLSELPVQSVGTPSTAHVEARVTSGAPLVMTYSTQIWLEFSANFSNVLLYGTAGRAYPAGDPRRTTSQQFLTNLAATSQNLFNVVGRVYSNGSIVDVRTLPASMDGQTTLKQSAAVKGAWYDLYDWSSYPTVPLGGPSNPNNYRICSSWLTVYKDAGHGEDYATQTTLESFSLPARYSHVVVTNKQNQFKWQGTLDADGCTPYIELTPGDYVLWQTGSLISGTTTLDVYYRDNAGWKEGLTLLTGFSTQPSLVGQTIELQPPVFDHMTRTAGAMSQVLATPDNGLVAGETYPVRADQPCPGQPLWGACGGEDGLYLGPNEYGGDHTNDWKYVIAHEFGHVVQALRMGFVNYEYVLAPDHLCRCDHVTSGNPVHCLQSREEIGGAQVEGWAQFYASRVWNNRDQSDCAFVYYKDVEFLSIEPPPVEVDCKYQMKWMENFCLASDQGTEWDWMAFLYDVNTAPASARSTIDDLGAIYVASCGGSLCETGNDQGHWSTLDGAAFTYYGGLGSAKYSRFVTASDNFGVNH